MAFLSSNNAYDISVFEDDNLENQDLHKKNKVVKIPKKKIEQAKRNAYLKTKTEEKVYFFLSNKFYTIFSFIIENLFI